MKTTPPKSSDVRQWARQKGLEVGERGRLSPDVLAAYSAAHGGPPVKAAAKKAVKKTARKAAKAPAKRRVPAKPQAAPATTATPVVALESARVEALESKLAALSARIERLESARAAAPAKRGLFARKG